MSSTLFKPGDVVQLQSGGRPVTVASYAEGSKLRVAGMSEGGLACELVVEQLALKKYNGPIPYVAMRERDVIKHFKDR